MRHHPRLIDEEQRLAVDTNVARISERRKNALEVRFVIGNSRILLFDKDAIRRAMPNSRPGIVCPAKAKGEVRFPCFQDFREDTLEDSPSIPKPVVPITKALDAVA